MAIKVNNTTVIDDSRNITNINSATATSASLTSATISNATITDTITPTKLKVAGNTLFNTLEKVTANDIAGWYYNRKSFSIAAQEPTAGAVFFRPDGTRFYIVGSTNDTVYQYNLTTPWDISTASFTAGQSFSIAAQEATANSLFFRDDGTKMYILGTTNDSIYQYTLATAWDVTTATYDNVSFSVTAQDGTPTGLYFRPNGLEFYISGDTNNAVFKYTLTSAWDISTASYANVSFSVATQESLPQDIWFTSDGLKLYIVGSNRRGVTEYTLSTAWNITTATISGFFNINNFESVPVGLYFSEEQNLVFIIGSGNDAIYEVNANTESTHIGVNKLHIRSDVEMYSSLAVNANIIGESIRSVGNMNVGASLGVNTISASNNTTAATLFDALTTGTFTALSGMTTAAASIGGTAQTGALTLGRSTATQAVGIATGVTASGSTKTLNLATGGATGSTTNINIGSTSSTTITDFPIGDIGAVKISRNTGQYLQLFQSSSGSLIYGYSATNNAKPMVFDSTTDINNTAPTVGTTGYVFRIMGVDSITANASTLTITQPNTLFNATNPVLSSSNTGTLSLFNTNLTTVNAFGAANSISLGSSTGTTTINNSTVTLSNATTLNINGSSPTLSTTSTGTLTLFNTNIGTVNAFGAASSITLGNQSNTASSTFTISGASNTIGSKSILIGTNGQSGSSTSITLGTTAGGSSSVTSNGTFTVTPATAGDTITIGGTSQTGTITIGQSTASQNISIGTGNAGAGSTRTIAIANNGASGSTTSINIGGGAGTSTTTLGGSVTANSFSSTSAAISGGSINNTPIGATTANTGSFTSLSATGTVSFDATTQSISVGTSQTTGTILLGGTAQTGVITIGRSTASQQINIGNAATGNGASSIIAMGTGGAAGSTTQIFIGGSANTSTTEIRGTLTTAATTQNISIGTSQSTGTLTLGGTAQTGTITIGQSTAAQNINIGTGATANATSRTIAIANNGASGSTTSINIGGGAGTSTTNLGGVNKYDATDGLAATITSASPTMNLASSDTFMLTATATTNLAFSNPPASGRAKYITLEITNGGNFAITWPTNTRWPGGTAPTLTTNGVDVVAFFTDNGGADYRAALVQKDSK